MFELQNYCLANKDFFECRRNLFFNLYSERIKGKIMIFYCL